MQYVKTIKNEQGTYNIQVSMWINSSSWETDGNGNQFRYDVFVEFIPKGKRKALFGNFIEEVRNIDIQRAKLEFWELLKPKAE